MQRTMLFEKWRSPWGEPEDFEVLKQNLKHQHEKETAEKDEIFGDEDDDMLDELDMDEIAESLTTPKLKAIITQIGVIPMEDHTNIGKIFNFWTIHTNFRLTNDIREIIDNTDGIETFDIYSPYRWRIAIGKAFNSSEVKQNLMKNLDAVSGVEYK
jgi:hypothetical protein